MRRKRAIFFGFVVVGLGVILLLLDFAVGAGALRYVVAVSTVGIGIIRIVNGMAISAEDELLATQLTDDLGTGGDGGPQIAGRTCAQCHKKILGEADGKVCKRCDENRPSELRARPQAQCPWRVVCA